MDDINLNGLHSTEKNDNRISLVTWFETKLTIVILSVLIKKNTLIRQILKERRLFGLQ